MIQRSAAAIINEARIQDLSNQIHNADIGAAIIQLDLVISVDICVAHLTKVLGKPM